MNALKYLEGIARKSVLIRHSRHAAAVTYKGRVLAVGEAKYKTHPFQKKVQQQVGNTERIYLHAEVDALLKVINKHGTEILQECELHVVRISKGGFVGSSKPCSGCQRAISAFKIRKVIHT